MKMVRYVRASSSSWVGGAVSRGVRPFGEWVTGCGGDLLTSVEKVRQLCGHGALY